MGGDTEIERQRGEQEEGVEIDRERDTEDNVERRLLPISAVSSAKSNSDQGITFLWLKFLLRALFFFFVFF